MRLNVMKYSKVPISLRYQKYPGNLGMFMNRSKLYTFHKWFSNVRSVGASLWNAPPFLNWVFKTRIPSVRLHCADVEGSQRVTTWLGHMKKHFESQGEHSWLPALRGLSCFSHVQLCNPMGCSPPSASVLGILQARILEWVAISSCKGSSWARDQTCCSCISCTGRWVLYHLHYLGSDAPLTAS